MSNESGFDIYKTIIKPLRDADDTTMLQRFMVGPQAIHDQAEAQILTLPQQFNPDTVRSDLLLFLKDIVGFTNELRNITDRLTEIQIRRLIKVAVPLWNERHTPQGLINSIRLLTGRNAYYTSWFGFRTILGEVTLTEDQLVSGGDFWLIGGSISTYDEFWSNIRLMDDGTLDPVLLLDVCQLMRPLDERFEVFLDDFLDRFDAVLDKWQNTDNLAVAAQGAIDAVTFPDTLQLFSGGELQPIIPIISAPSGHHDYNVATKFLLQSATSQFVARWYTTTSANGTAYELTISKQSVKLVRIIAGAATVLVAAFNPPTVNILPQTWYALRLSIVTGTPQGNEIRILIDGNLIIPTSGSGAFPDGVSAPITGLPTSGPYMFKNTGSDNVWFDNVESWRNPGRFATIQLSTPTERGGAITTSSNFVL